ncbi:MAG TPA: hypothetical protein VMV92_45520 [Streptosporangiaceae bacterium]|nr:hypothetical protein [Streptosporangiaceae bacterium]
MPGTSDTATGRDTATAGGTATGREAGGAGPGPGQRAVAAELPAGGTAGRLLRFALANIARRPDRFVLSTAGIALAVMAVIVVRTISLGFASSGSASLTTVLGRRIALGRPARRRALRPACRDARRQWCTALHVPAGWHAQRTLTGIWASPGGETRPVRNH